ncbi:hypothetical protein GMJAKD_02950 [Candidatus Electrothrix aarhusensis]
MRETRSVALRLWSDFASTRQVCHPRSRLPRSASSSIRTGKTRTVPPPLRAALTNRRAKRVPLSALIVPQSTTAHPVAVQHLTRFLGQRFTNQDRAVMDWFINPASRNGASSFSACSIFTPLRCAINTFMRFLLT